MAGYLRNVCMNVLIVTALTFIPTYVVYTLVSANGWGQFIAVGMTSVISSTIAIVYVGCTSNEREFFITKALMLKNKFSQCFK